MTFETTCATFHKVRSMGPISEMDMVSVLSCSYIFLSDMVVVKKSAKKENLF